MPQWYDCKRRLRFPLQCLSSLGWGFWRCKQVARHNFLAFGIRVGLWQLRLWESHSLLCLQSPSTLIIANGKYGGALVQGTAEQSDVYRSDIKNMLAAIDDSRVRWIDGLGVSKEMKMHTETGSEYVAGSVHFHQKCPNFMSFNGSNPIKVCFNITEIVSQLLLGYTLGTKRQFWPQSRAHGIGKMQMLETCTACPANKSVMWLSVCYLLLSVTHKFSIVFAQNIFRSTLFCTPTWREFLVRWLCALVLINMILHHPKLVLNHVWAKKLIGHFQANQKRYLYEHVLYDVKPT